MRGLKRNQRECWYQLYLDKVPVYETDLDGNIICDPVTGEPLETGDSSVGYANPVKFRANVSAARGEASNDPFGISAEYDKTVCSCDTKLPIDELTRLFIDRKPEFNDTGVLMNKPDYSVTKVAKSLNSALYAIKRLVEGK